MFSSPAIRPAEDQTQMLLDRFTVTPLDRRRIDQAFPLIQAGRSGITREEWHAYADCMIAATDGGIRLAQADHGYIHGLYAFQVLPSPRHGKVLQVDMFLALDMFEQEEAIDLLLRDMDNEALARGCGAVHLHLPQAERPAAPSRALERAISHGHHREDLRLCRVLV